MSPSTIPEVIDDAQELYTALTDDLDINLVLPEIEFSTDFIVPEFDASLAAKVSPMTVEELTCGTVEGSGVFDTLMKATTAHLEEQFKKNRIVSADYAKVYLGSIQTVMQQAIAFMLGKDRAYLENLQLIEMVKLAQIQTVKASAELEVARAQIQITQLELAKSKLEAYTARNQYALSKMSLVTGYNGVLTSEAQVKLIHEQYETQRAQTRETNSDGDPIEGILQYEKNLKAAQVRLVDEQYTSQRAQTRNVHEDTTDVEGLIGAQRRLYIQQTTAYVRDGEHKFIKMIMDTWTARKTIDEGVAVPDQIDTDKIDEMVLAARTQLNI